MLTNWWQPSVKLWWLDDPFQLWPLDRRWRACSTAQLYTSLTSDPTATQWIQVDCGRSRWFFLKKMVHLWGMKARTALLLNCWGFLPPGRGCPSESIAGSKISCGGLRDILPKIAKWNDRNVIPCTPVGHLPNIDHCPWFIMIELSMRCLKMLYI